MALERVGSGTGPLGLDYCPHFLSSCHSGQVCKELRVLGPMRELGPTKAGQFWTFLRSGGS